MKNLATLYGVHPTSISQCLHSLAVPLRDQGLRGEDLPEASRLYEAGWSLTKLADKYNCNPTTAWRRLRENGVIMRPRQGWRY